MRYLLGLVFFAFLVNAEELRIEPGADFSFPIKQQKAWIERATEQLALYKKRPSTSLKKQLYLVLTSDKNKDLELNEAEKRCLELRLMSLCYYYQVYFYNFNERSAIYSSTIRGRINRIYEDFVPGMDLKDPHYNSRYKYWESAEPSYY